MKHLEVSNIRFRRGDFSLAASLALGKGETGVILGPSGCGKTTLLRCIAGLEQQEEGRISISGREIGNVAPEKRDIGFIFQDLALFDHLTGRENIEFGLRLRRIPRAEASRNIDALAEKLQILSLLDRKPFSMSGGEKQRLAFARAIAVKPEILLMDEPLSSLDAPLRRELRTYLRTTLSREGITALHVTHDVEEALELADEIFLMNGGRILARGSPQSIYENPPDAWCVDFLGLGTLLPVRRIEIRDDLVIAETPYGSFSCPHFACRVDKPAIDEGSASFYVPRGAATPIGHPARPDDWLHTDNVIVTSVDSTVFQGDYRRLVVHAVRQLPAERSGAEMESIDDDFSMELKIELGLSVTRGETLRLSIDAGKCGILPLHAGISP